MIITICIIISFIIISRIIVIIIIVIIFSLLCGEAPEPAVAVFLVDALMRSSAEQDLSELLRVSRRPSLALVIRHLILKEKL